MATDAEARAAGFATPAGTELISGGDDAIRQNARTALDLINAAKFIKPYEGGGGDLDNYTTPGLHGYWIDTANIPPAEEPTSGNVLVLPPPAGTGIALTQIAFPYGMSATQFKRFRGTGGYSAWVRMDAGAIDLSALGGGASGSSPTAFKTVPVALTVGGGIQNYPATQGGVRIPVNFSVPIKRWRLHIRNINPRQGEPGAGNVTISSVYIGRHAGAADPGVVVGGNTLVGGEMSSIDGSDMVTPWSSTEISAAYEYLISFGWTASQQPKQVVGGGFTTTTVDGAFNNSTIATRSVNLPLDVWIEAEVEADVPVIAGFGDSLTSGVGAVLPVFNSWLSAYCRTHKAIPVHYSASGDTMAGWSDPDHYKWTRWDRLTRPDAVVHAMGSNDVFGGASLTTMQDRFRHTVDLLAEKVSPVVYAATIMPREGSAGDAMEQVRRDYNAWLAGRTRDLFDFVGAVSLDDETLIDSIDADGIHLTAAGYVAVAGAITRPLTSSAIGGLTYDSGVRDVSSLLINGWTGTLYLLIQGDDVILTAEGLDGTNATSGRFINLPTGAQPRPRGSSYTTRARGAIYLADGTPRRWDSADQGVTTIRGHVTGTGGDVLYGDMWMKTIDPPPATPPGAPA